MAPFEFFAHNTQDHSVTSNQTDNQSSNTTMITLLENHHDNYLIQIISQTFQHPWLMSTFGSYPEF